MHFYLGPSHSWPPLGVKVVGGLQRAMAQYRSSMRALGLEVVGHAQATGPAVCTPGYDPISSVQEAKVPWADRSVQPAAVQGMPGLQLALHSAMAVIS